MSEIPRQLLDVTECVETAEKRVAAIRAHVERLARDGQDAAGAEELLTATCSVLRLLYACQGVLRWHLMLTRD